MLPRRKLSEIFTSANVNRNFCNIVVEGPTDHVIMRSFCEGAQLSVMIYPITNLEVDCIDAAAPGGNKGRVIRTSELASSRDQRRMFCVVDRDDTQFHTFQLNSHCFVTDLSCLEMYALDVGEFHAYVQRSFQIDCTLEDFQSVTRAAHRASWLHWRRIVHVADVSLASIERSLTVKERRIDVDLVDWVKRSRSRGGSADAWDRLEAEAAELTDADHDPRVAASIHKLDDVLLFWLRETTGVSLPSGWMEGHMRGLATYERLSQYPFFMAVRQRCLQELGQN